jgi:hypothetical protein
MNPITKMIGNAFLGIGSRLTGGPRTTEGDYSTIMLPTYDDPRTRSNQVIIVRSTSGYQVGWNWVCACGTTNALEVLQIDRKLRCYTCKKEFCIKTLIEESIRRDRAIANRTRGLNIKIDKAISTEEWDAKLADLPTIVPGTQSSNNRLDEIRKQLDGGWDGETVYEPADYSSGGFSEPYSHSRH